LTVLDQWLGVCLIPLALWVVISGLDDLVLDFAWAVYHFRRFAWPAEEALAGASRKRIAVFVPLWREEDVIGNMLSHNAAAIRYDNYDFFVGAYPNDSGTIEAIRRAQERFSHVHLALCPHAGPTTKADCLNWIYQRMLLYEEKHGARFDIVVTHDAEDVIHPDSLRWINYYSREYEMVQVPVLPLPTPVWELTHGLYCDEFAEYHAKDVPVRRLLGGFVPSCGVGTGFTREALEMLAGDRANRIFEPACLTEDYENGLRIHELGLPQLFIPVRPWKNGFLATREYFPRRFRAAVRQRTRWTIGIALQTWERHQWRGGLGCKYWLWRDRKALVGSLIAPAANLLFLYGMAAWLARGVVLAQGWIAQLSFFTLTIAGFHLAVRMACSGRVYGWAFAAGAPFRALWGNWLNCYATVAALARYGAARWKAAPLVWLKTEHMYPNRDTLSVHRRRLGEILVDSAALSSTRMEQAAAECPSGTRIGEYLIACGLATEQDVYEALAVQHNLGLGLPEPMRPEAVGCLPPAVSRRWRVLPYRVADGALHVAGTDAPCESMRRDLSRFYPLEIRFRLITPSDWAALAGRHLPPA
jgi:adsorption protein B